MPGPAVQVRGLDEFRRDLRKMDNGRRWTREFAAENRGIAREVAPKAQERARSLGGQPGHFAGAIRGYGSAPAARLGIASAGKGQRNWGANAAMWGVKDNITGRNRSTTPNLKVPWVGNTWDVVYGQGPTAIVDTIVAETPRIVNEYGDAIENLTRRAFPD